MRILLRSGFPLMPEVKKVYGPYQRRRPKIEATIDPEIRDRSLKFARQVGITLSALIERSLRTELDRFGSIKRPK